MAWEQDRTRRIAGASQQASPLASHPEAKQEEENTAFRSGHGGTLAPSGGPGRTGITPAGPEMKRDGARAPSRSPGRWGGQRPCFRITATPTSAAIFRLAPLILSRVSSGVCHHALPGP